MTNPPRIIALLAFHNEMEYLAGYISNVQPHVDGIVALDDGSTDGSGDFIARQDKVLELVRIAARTPHLWDEPNNRRMLVAAGRKYKPDWFVAVDADERLEKDFRERAIREIERANDEGLPALSVNIRELWNSPVHYRSDGNWGAKRHARLFRDRDDAELDPRAVHGHWAPLNSKSEGGYPEGDLNLYHLRMIDPVRRQARRERYETLDPENVYQPIGYSHLTDETGLELQRLPEGREYEPLSVTTADLACVVLSVGHPPELVAAVQSLLDQPHHIEIVVVNSGGGTAAHTLLVSPAVRIIEIPQRVLPGAARNAGISSTSAPYVAFLAADCIAEEGWVRERLNAHRQGAPAVASAVTNPFRRNVAAWTSYVSLFCRRMPGVPTQEALLYGVSYDRALFDRFGLFREDMRGGEDTEFNRRLTPEIEIRWVPAVRTAHRHSRSFGALLHDHYRRGRRMAAMWQQLDGPGALSVMKSALKRFPASTRIAWRAAGPGERRWVFAAALLIIFPSVAYAIGAVTHAAAPRAEEPE